MIRAILIGALLALSACGDNVTSIGQVPGCGITTGVTLDEKVMLSAETAYNIAANAYLSVKDVPAFQNVKPAAKSALEQAYAELKVARMAYKAGDTCFNSIVAGVIRDANSALTIIKGVR